MTDKMKNDIDKFIADKTVGDINRDAFLVCNLEDKVKELTISLVFLRDWNSTESNTYDFIYLQNKGAVITLPCYWLSIPRKLSTHYIEFVINEVYKEIEGSSSSNGSNSSGTNCGHNCTYI